MYLHMHTYVHTYIRKYIRTYILTATVPDVDAKTTLHPTLPAHNVCVCV